jgi:hypothetical protein
MPDHQPIISAVLTILGMVAGAGVLAYVVCRVLGLLSDWTDRR